MTQKVNISLKGIVSLFTMAIVGLCIVLLVAFLRSGPPDENRLLQKFYQHRTEYNHLRDMLLSDSDLIRVSNGSVEVANLGIVRPGGGGISLDRYDEYISLLDASEGKWAFRNPAGEPAMVGIGVWASGFGGDTRHVEICWLEQGPDHVVANLSTFYKTPKPRSPAFRHIEENWYLRADW